MEQDARLHAVDRQPEMSEVDAAHGEIAAEVVVGDHARQRLHGAKRVVNEHRADALHRGAAEHLARRNRLVGDRHACRP